MLGHLLWPQAYCDFLHVVDRAEWVCERLAQADFDPIGVPESSPALQFVRRVLIHVKESWQAYMVPVDQWDNALAMLMLLHMPVRCVVKPQDGDDDDDDIVEEVSSDELVSHRFR